MLGERLFAVFDLNGDGDIDWTEFMSGVALYVQGLIFCMIIQFTEKLIVVNPQDRWRIKYAYCSKCDRSPHL